jgi:hypothetical protein
MQARIWQTSLSMIVLALFVMVVGGTPLAQSINAEVGTWNLNLAKSKYKDGRGPKRATHTIEPAGAGIRTIVDGVSGDGTVRHYEFTANYDGKDHPLVGNSANGDMIALTRINATTIQAVTKHGGQVAVTMTWVVSSDAKTLTITSTGTNVFGQAVNNLSVYDRQ